MIVDYHKLNLVVIQMAVVVPDMVSLLEQINTCPGICYVTIELASAFFSILVSKVNQKQFSNVINLPPGNWLITLGNSVTAGSLLISLSFRDVSERDCLAAAVPSGWGLHIMRNDQ